MSLSSDARLRMAAAIVIGALTTFVRCQVFADDKGLDDRALRAMYWRPMFSTREIDDSLQPRAWKDFLQKEVSNDEWRDPRLLLYDSPSEVEAQAIYFEIEETAGENVGRKGSINPYCMEMARGLVDARLLAEARTLVLFGSDEHVDKLLDEATVCVAMVLLNTPFNFGVLTDEQLRIVELQRDDPRFFEQWPEADLVRVLDRAVCRRVRLIQLPAGAGTTDAALEKVGQLRQLQGLSLFKSEISDEGLAHLAKLDRLAVLNLDGTRVGDDGLAHVAKLRELQSLSLNGTSVTDAGLAHLQSLPKLMEIRVVGTKVTADGLARLKGKVATLKFVEAPKQPSK